MARPAINGIFRKPTEAGCQPRSFPDFTSLTSGAYSALTPMTEGSSGPVSDFPTLESYLPAYTGLTNSQTHTPTTIDNAIAESDATKSLSIPETQDESLPKTSQAELPTAPTTEQPKWNRARPAVFFHVGEVTYYDFTQEEVKPAPGKKASDDAKLMVDLCKSIQGNQSRIELAVRSIDLPEIPLEKFEQYFGNGGGSKIKVVRSRLNQLLLRSIAAMQGYSIRAEWGEWEKAEAAECLRQVRRIWRHPAHVDSDLHKYGSNAFPEDCPIICYLLIQLCIVVEREKPQEKVSKEKEGTARHSVVSLHVKDGCTNSFQSSAESNPDRESIKKRGPEESGQETRKRQLTTWESQTTEARSSIAPTRENQATTSVASLIRREPDSQDDKKGVFNNTNGEVQDADDSEPDLSNLNDELDIAAFLDKHSWSYEALKKFAHRCGMTKDEISDFMIHFLDKFSDSWEAPFHSDKLILAPATREDRWQFFEECLKQLQQHVDRRLSMPSDSPVERKRAEEAGMKDTEHVKRRLSTILEEFQKEVKNHRQLEELYKAFEEVEKEWEPIVAEQFAVKSEDAVEP